MTLVRNGPFITTHSLSQEWAPRDLNINARNVPAGGSIVSGRLSWHRMPHLTCYISFDQAYTLTASIYDFSGLKLLEKFTIATGIATGVGIFRREGATSFPETTNIVLEVNNTGAADKVATCHLWGTGIK